MLDMALGGEINQGHGITGRRVRRFFTASFLVLVAKLCPHHQATGFSTSRSVVPLSSRSKAQQSRGARLFRDLSDRQLEKNSKEPLALDELPSDEVAGHDDKQQPFTETVARSAVKTLTWRALSSLVTLQTTLIFTGRLQDALRILAVSFLPKFFSLFVLDRLVNRGPRRITSKLQRSLIKVLAWRTFSIISNMALATLVLRDTIMASKIVSADFVSKTFLIFLYEQLWSQISWGKQSVLLACREHNGGDNDEATAVSTANGAPKTSTSLSMTAGSDEKMSSLPKQGGSILTQTDSQGKALESFSWENQWYPVMPMSYLEGFDGDDKPVPISVLGRNLVVWKAPESEWSIFEDICPHRRSPLSTGQDVGGCLTCRYHGWEFDAKGQVTKVPMRPPDQDTPTASVQAHSFPSQSAGGILWAFLGKTDDENNVPALPLDAIPTEEQTAGADWMFNRNPISYISMMENTFDPAHSPWTHEQMVGFGGMSFSPSDTVPMKRYAVREAPTNRGFSLEHTPYQKSTAQVAGPDSLTFRTFVPPCTVSVASPPFFQTSMWFVPANKYETNLLSFYRTPETRWTKLTSRSPKLQEFVKDTEHTLQYLGDWNYRFLSQDRITMQGQDIRKVGKMLKDLTPDPSDTGVATFQYWLQTIAGGGPFAPVFADSRQTSQDSFFSRELSFFESHGRFCPRCQRSMRRVSDAKIRMARWSSRFLVASIASAVVAGGTNSSRILANVRVAKAGSVLAISLLVLSSALQRAVEWCIQKENRMHSVGAALWPPHKTVFGYRSDK